VNENMTSPNEPLTATSKPPLLNDHVHKNGFLPQLSISVPGKAAEPPQNISKIGWLNRHSSSSGSLVSLTVTQQQVGPTSPTSYNWRLTRAILKNGVLSLYKPPNELAIKAFDPLLESAPSLAESIREPVSATTATNAGSISGYPRSPGSMYSGMAGHTPGHKRIVSSPSFPQKAMASLTLGGKLSYKETDRHPDLILDSKGQIKGGTDEAICHAILFGPDEEFAKSGVLALPLFTDMAVALDIIREYASLPLRNQPSITGTFICERVRLILNTIMTNFKGMLLDNTIHAGLQNLADSISVHNDELATNLKLLVFQRHQKMNKLLVYSRDDNDFLWSMQQKAADLKSEKARKFLAKVESGQAIDGAAGASSSTPRFSAINIPPDVFLELTHTELLASQISCFHLKLYKEWSPASDISLLFKAKYNYPRQNPLVFDFTNLHFLGALILDHLFNTKYSKIDSEYRGRLISHWITLGNSLKSMGDIVGWIAIATVICSIPVLRLRDAWSHVPSDLRESVIKDWGPEVFEIDKRSKIDVMSKKTFRVSTEEMGEAYPKERAVPYFGDLTVVYDDESDFKQSLDRINRIKTVFNGWEQYFEQVPQNDTFGPAPQPNFSVQKLLYSLLAHNSNQPVLTPDEILRMSLSIEPATSGTYLKYHYSQRSPLMNGSYLPLIFTETNPSYKLFSKQALIAASGVTSHSKRSIRSTATQRSDGTVNSLGTRHGSASGLAGSASTNSSTSSLNTFITGTTLQRSNSFPPATNGSFALTTGFRDVDYSSRQFVTKHTSRHVLMKNIRDVLNVGAALYHINDDIVLKSFDEEASGSRPSSFIETPSKRLSTASRRVSAQFAGDNLNGATDFASFAKAFEKTVNVVVKAANFERLVDILVLGVNEFGSFVHKEDLQKDGKTIVPQFRIDMNIHTLTFFATFRSFCSPLDLLNSLRRRFVGAKSAAISIVDSSKQSAETEVHLYPNWESSGQIADNNPIAWRIVAQVQIGVLEACHLWVSQYFFDFVNDLNLRDQFSELLKVFGSEITSGKTEDHVSDDYKVYLEQIEGLFKRVRNNFVKKSYRPNDIRPLLPSTSVAMKFDSLPVGQSSQIQIKLEKLITDINSVVNEYYSLIQVKDWIELFEVVEVQSTDLSGFFTTDNPTFTTNDDEVVIQDIYGYLDTLYRDQREEKVIKKFPAGVQGLLGFYRNLCAYLTYQICDPVIHRDDRVARMMTILKMLGLCKTRMTYLELFHNGSADQDQIAVANSNGGISTHVPSLIESAIVAAILKPESRLYANSWIQAGKLLSKTYSGNTGHGAGTSLINGFEIFAPILDRNELLTEESHQELVPCVGWIIERMFEIVCYVPSMSVENGSLINFDKRRYVYNLVTNITEMRADGQRPTSGEYVLTLKKIAYLVTPDKNLYLLDRKTVKESAAKELKDYPRANSKYRVFTSYLISESDKIKRDSKQREIIERQLRDMKKSTLRYKNTQQNITSGSSISDKKLTKSRFGGFLKSVRPISIFSSISNPASDRVVSVFELPDIGNLNDIRYKPLVSLNLIDFDIALVRGRDYFRIVSHNGAADYCFQALSDIDAESWVGDLQTAKRFATVRAQTSPSFTKVFGVPIQLVCEREGRDLPMVVETLLQEIESRGIDEVGLYRVPGSVANVQALKAAFDSGQKVNMEDDRWFDINTVAGCFKLYLRELSEPLLTLELFSEFLSCGNGGNTPENTAKLRQLINQLPAVNYNLLKRLVQHLGLVAEHEQQNKMKPLSLSIVFSMSFYPSSDASHSMVPEQMGAMQNVVNTMILNHDKIFEELESDEDGEFTNLPTSTTAPTLAPVSTST
jgi:GTPase-activating protein BEM2